MKNTVYIETTIPSYLISKLSRDIFVLSHQEITKNWWNNHRKEYSLFTSKIVVEEILRGDPELSKKRKSLLSGIPVLDVTEKIENLAKNYFEFLGIPKKSILDSFHLAIAVYNEIDFLLTWNCKHLANAYTRRKLADYNIKFGYKIPDICTPEELIKSGDLYVN